MSGVARDRRPMLGGLPNIPLLDAPTLLTNPVPNAPGQGAKIQSLLLSGFASALTGNQNFFAGVADQIEKKDAQIQALNVENLRVENQRIIAQSNLDNERKMERWKAESGVVKDATEFAHRKELEKLGIVTRSSAKELERALEKGDDLMEEVGVNVNAAQSAVLDHVGRLSTKIKAAKTPDELAKITQPFVMYDPDRRTWVNNKAVDPETGGAPVIAQYASPADALQEMLLTIDEEYSGVADDAALKRARRVVERTLLRVIEQGQATEDSLRKQVEDSFKKADKDKEKDKKKPKTTTRGVGGGDRPTTTEPS